ncbi:YCF48-related protein [Mariniblastus sp.]|nr:YCF48-related protein [Mariniblastus sp.]
MKTKPVDKFLLIITISAFICGFTKANERQETKNLAADPWKVIQLNTKASLRGLHVFSESTILASGTGGTIAHSTDAGKTWDICVVPGAEELDFRDIHAINSQTIVAMTSGTPACVYRSTDGGSNWRRVYENKDEKIFLDALSFFNQKEGIIMGDPIDGKIFLLKTSDGGNSWKPTDNSPETLPGEAGFAASGTNMITTADSNIFIALGGALKDEVSETSRIAISQDAGKQWAMANVPIPRGPSSGMFSVCFFNQKCGVVVGGNYTLADNETHNYAVSSDGGITWIIPKGAKPPSGYRSCVTRARHRGLPCAVTVGPGGTDISFDLGHTWKRISETGFHSIQFSPKGNQGWASGSDGRIGLWQQPDNEQK